MAYDPNLKAILCLCVPNSRYAEVFLIQGVQQQKAPMKK